MTQKAVAVFVDCGTFALTAAAISKLLTAKKRAFFAEAHRRPSYFTRREKSWEERLKTLGRATQNAGSRRLQLHLKSPRFRDSSRDVANFSCT